VTQKTLMRGICLVYFYNSLKFNTDENPDYYALEKFFLIKKGALEPVPAGDFKNRLSL
jgi:hypothetical protein